MPPDDTAIAELRRLAEARAVARWRSDGFVRRCGAADGSEHAEADAVADVLYPPPQRLAVIGWDPFALAIAAAGGALGWATTLIRPAGPDAPPPVDAAYSRLPVDQALTWLRPDPWTAVAIVTHDLELDHDALVAALGTRAGYVRVLGARRRLPERLARLRDAGLDVSEAASSKGDKAKVQSQLNVWAAETGLPYIHISRILSMSIGPNRTAEELAQYMGGGE